MNENVQQTPVEQSATAAPSAITTYEGALAALKPFVGSEMQPAALGPVVNALAQFFETRINRVTRTPEEREGAARDKVNATLRGGRKYFSPQKAVPSTAPASESFDQPFMQRKAS